jgi:glycerophosphoryl diester phosphodiesterase
MRPYLTHEHPIRFAHRGSRVLWPENTMTAFQGAVDLGYRYLETDVHVTRDDVVVVFHDDVLDRLTDGTGKVWDWRWEDLRTLDAAFHFAPDRGFPLRGSGIGIPTLDELVRTFPEALVNIDLKQNGIAERVAIEVDRLGIGDRVMIGSFHGRRIARFRRATGGTVATSAGPAEVPAALAGRAGAVGADAFQVPEGSRGMRIVTRRFVDRAHAAGKHVHVWTVNEPDAMHRLLDLGVDGIVTDRPDLLDDVLAARSAS